MSGEGVSARIAKAERYLRTAQLAYDDGDYDSCVSRAYYAAFHGCIVLLVLYVDKKAVDWQHSTIINNFVGAFTKRRKWFNHLKMKGAPSFAVSLARLHTAREVADYEVDVIDREKAETSVRFAELVVGEVKKRAVQ